MMNLFLKLPSKFAGNYLNNPSSNQEEVIIPKASPGSTDIIQKMTIGFFDQAKTSWASAFNSTADFFKSYLWKEILFNAKLILVILSILMLTAIVIIIIKTMGLGAAAKKAKDESAPVVFNKRKIYKKWLKIEKKLNSGIEANYKLAILDADKLFNQIIQKTGIDKEKTLTSIYAIKDARKIKNVIIEDRGFLVTKEIAEKSLMAYKRGLEELGAV